MAHTYTCKECNGSGSRRLYRYYVCVTRQKRGRDACPSPSLPAQEIEAFVVDHIRKLARDPELAKAVFQEASEQQRALIPKLQTERQRLVRDRQAKSEQIQRLLAVLASSDTPQPSVSERLAELEGIVGKLNDRLTEIDSELTTLERNRIDPDDVARALAQFDDLYDVLFPRERSRIARSLIATITYEATGEVRIALNPGAIRDLGFDREATANSC
jgi:site-specific DNA recombinase